MWHLRFVNGDQSSGFYVLPWPSRPGALGMHSGWARNWPTSDVRRRAGNRRRMSQSRSGRQARIFRRQRDERGWRSSVKRQGRGRNKNRVEHLARWAMDRHCRAPTCSRSLREHRPIPRPRPRHGRNRAGTRNNRLGGSDKDCAWRSRHQPPCAVAAAR